MIIWFIGMSGAGKSAIGSRVHKMLKAEEPNTVLIDGDVIRKFFPSEGEAPAYTVAERRKNSQKIRQICKWLDEQGMNVVCCILSIFPEASAWNRANYSEYYEIYVKVPFTELVRRDQKGLYSRAENGEESNVVGFDIPFPEPENPDLVLENGAELISLDILAQKAYNALLKSRQSKLYPYDEGNRLEVRNTYAYSELSHNFLNIWKAKRKAVINSINTNADYTPQQNSHNFAIIKDSDIITKRLLIILLAEINEERMVNVPQQLLKIINKFEVSKRLYTKYTCTWKAEGRYDNMELYLLFSEVLIACYLQTRRLDLLNALLKSNDTLIACRDKIPPDLEPQLRFVITKELELVESLRGEEND